jgi:NAD-dependent DNA ligase
MVFNVQLEPFTNGIQLSVQNRDIIFIYTQIIDGVYRQLRYRNGILIITDTNHYTPVSSDDA